MENIQVPPPAFASGQNSNQQMQYAARKRRRPQPKNKEKKSGGDGATTASNPSKRHRDRLNTELDNLSKLIPLPEDTVNKLDKLSILRLAVSYLRNKAFHKAESTESIQFQRQSVTRNVLASSSSENMLGGEGASPNMDLGTIVNAAKETESSLLLKSLDGFIIIVTEEYNIFYISDNVQDYLGFPQSDLMNMSMMELIHAEDRHILMKNISIDNTVHQSAESSPTGSGSSGGGGGGGQHAPSYTKFNIDSDLFQNLSDNGMMYRSFICRFRCLLDNSSGFLTLHCSGHLKLLRGQNRQSEAGLMSPEIALVLMASPLQSPSVLEIRTKSYVFRTKHKLDYTPLCIDSKGTKVLGYSEAKLRLRSGYEFIHSADMMHCADAHTKLMTKGESGSTVFRLLHYTNRWVWVFASARLVFRNGRPDYIISTHRPLPDSEGKEYLEKRNAAFRFDFVGQGILYNDINPIGAGGGPENNPLPQNNGSNDPFSEHSPPVSKKMKIENPVGGFDDRLSIKGVMSMQRSDIYVNNSAIENIEQSVESDFLDCPVQPLTAMVKMEPPSQMATSPPQNESYMRQQAQQQGMNMNQQQHYNNSPQNSRVGHQQQMSQQQHAAGMNMAGGYPPPQHQQHVQTTQQHQMPPSNGNSHHHHHSVAPHSSGVAGGYNNQQQPSHPQQMQHPTTTANQQQQQSANLKRSYEAMNMGRPPYGIFSGNTATIQTLKHENAQFGGGAPPPMYPTRNPQQQQNASVSSNSPLNELPMSVSPPDGSSLASPNDTGYSSGDMENSLRYDNHPMSAGIAQNHPMSSIPPSNRSQSFHPQMRGKNMGQQQQQQQLPTTMQPPHHSRFSRGSGGVGRGKGLQQHSQSPGKGLEIMPALSPDLESLEVLGFVESSVEIDLDRIAVENQTLDPLSLIKSDPRCSLGYLTERYFSADGNQAHSSQDTNQIPFQHSNLQPQQTAANNNNSPPLYLPSKGKDGQLSSDNFDSSSDIYLSDT